MSKIIDIAKLKTQQHKLPSINKAKYSNRSGLEGPFMTKAGQVVYYDNKKGQYYNPDNDMYLSYDDWKKLSEEVELAEGRTLAKQWRRGGPNLKIGSIELVRTKNPYTDVNKIKKNGKEIGAFWLDDDQWVVDLDRARGQGIYHNIDDIVYDLKKNKMYFEDAPANATGTSVAGTGDDSSTVVVKKKKPLQDKLMRRLKIKETIDRTIPDLEYPKDEITERKQQLIDLAKKYGENI